MAEVDSAANEDTFVVPSGWRRSIIPRRGGMPTGTKISPPPSAEAGRELLASRVAGAEDVLKAPGNDPELVGAARAYLSAPEGATPLETAAFTFAALLHLPAEQRDRPRDLVDLWLTARGPVFAARTVVELADLGFEYDKRSRVVFCRGDGFWQFYDHHCWRLAGRLRAHLAVLGDQEHALVRTALADFRGGSLRHRVTTSFLLPDQTGWVEEDIAAVSTGTAALVTALWCAIGTAEQAWRLEPLLYGHWLTGQPRLLLTGAAGVGPALAPVLAHFWDHHGSVDKKRLSSVLAAFPTDEALRLLIERLDQQHVRPAVLEAAGRWPVRATRLLAEAADDSTVGRLAADLLRAHVPAHPEAVGAACAVGSPEVGERIRAVAGTADAAPEAPADDLPTILKSPPWIAGRKRSKPTVVDGLTAPAVASVVWAPGEREDWLACGAEYRQTRNWAGYAKVYAAGKLDEFDKIYFFINAPDEFTRPLISGWDLSKAWRPYSYWATTDWARALAARYETDAIPALLCLARKLPTVAGDLLVPLANAEVAELMADWFVRLKTARRTARTWLRRHPGAAASSLIPAAVGRPGRARNAAEQALRTLATTHRAEVVAAAQQYGEAAATAIEAQLAADPLEALPSTRVPELPSWVNPGLLPPVLLRDQGPALPADAVGHLCTMLAMSKPGDPYPGVPMAAAACDPRSLAAFAWELFDQWQAVGSPASQGWAFTALGHLGDDDTVRRLTPLIRAWPGEGGHAKAVTGLDVLADIGTDVALMHLHGIAQRVKFKGLKDRAQQKVAEVAADLELSADQLADRLVPTLGLNSRNSLVLDYGTRRFTVGFDEALKPYVTDAAGARLKALPKPGARDDAALAPEAYQRFATLKKDVRTLAADQITRLELAMVNGRRWPVAEFRTLLVEHPLLCHIVRRLVWVSFGPDGAAHPAFRVAEDLTFADVNDDQLALGQDALVGVAHPLHLGEQVRAWSRVFADYEILQPFRQLGRPVHTLTDVELKSETLDRFQGIAVPTGKVLGLERRGWHRGDAHDNGINLCIYRIVPSNRAIVAELDPGIAVGAVDYWPEQKFSAIWVNHRPTGGSHYSGGHLRFGDLDPVTASELLTDLIEVTTG